MRIVPAVLVVALAALPGATAVAGDEKAAPASAEAIFAGGCFWCMEKPFDELDGVVATISGYTGGRTARPTYEDVSSGGTGHREALLVRYDPARVSYEKLLEVFWRNVDPTDASGQFCDKGHQYTSAIYWRGPEQQRLAEASKQALIESGRVARVVTEVLAAAEFYPAEEYHQDYYRKNPLRYRYYRSGCGRDRRLAELWGEPAAKR